MPTREARRRLLGGPRQDGDAWASPHPSCLREPPALRGAAVGLRTRPMQLLGGPSTQGVPVACASRYGEASTPKHFDPRETAIDCSALHSPPPCCGGTLNAPTCTPPGVQLIPFSSSNEPVSLRSVSMRGQRAPAPIAQSQSGAAMPASLVLPGCSRRFCGRYAGSYRSAARLGGSRAQGTASR
jgi:hypothetical protein